MVCNWMNEWMCSSGIDCVYILYLFSIIEYIKRMVISIETFKSNYLYEYTLS